jgi:hypothetical protein
LLGGAVTVPPAAVPLTYTDIEHVVHPGPTVQVDGSAVRVVWDEFCEQLPLPGSWSRKFNVPPVPSVAIQYDVPAVIVADLLRETWFQADADGADLLPDASRVPGCPPLSA